MSGSSLHPLRPAVLLAATLLLAGCDREQPTGQVAPPAGASATGTRMVELQPGVARPKPVVRNPYAGNVHAINEGKRLFAWFNCSGCHANGGGGMGPPLIDDKWIYGSDPANLFASIMEGRPQGMPAFGGRIPDDEAWKLVAFIRALAGLEPGLPEGAHSKPLQEAASENLKQAPEALQQYYRETMNVP